MNFFKRLTTYLLLIFLFTGNLLAQEDQSSDSTFYEMSLEDLMDIEITTASKVEEKVSDAPGIISIITAWEIEQMGALSLAEVLDRMTGVINMSSFVRPQNSISFRGDLSGDYDNHVLILINGRPTRESLYGGFNSSILLGMPLASIEKIEVIRGPGSVLYGSNAYSGVINIILKKGSDDKVGQVNAMAGSFDGAGVDAFVTYDQSDLHVSLGFKRFDEEGWEFEATDLANIRDTTNYEEDNQGFNVAVEYKGLTFNSFIMESGQTVFGGGLPLWDGNDSKMFETKRSMTDIGYEFVYNAYASTAINATINTFEAGFQGAKGATNDLLLEISNFVSVNNKANIVFGGTYYKQTGDFEGSTATLVDPFNNLWYSGYLQADYRPIEDLKLIAGFQFNKIEDRDGNLVPRLGAIYHFSDKIGTKLLYGHAFRAPYGWESGVDLAGILQGNPDLEPEILKNLDFQFFYDDRGLELAATFFRSIKEDNIVREGPTFVNAGETTAMGLELEGKYIPNNNIYITASYAYQTNENKLEDGTVVDEFSLMPNSIAKLGISYQSNFGVSLGVFNTYVSEFNQFQGQADLPMNNGDTDGFYSLSANLRFNIPRLLNLEMKNNIIFGLYATNLTDEEINMPDFTTRTLSAIPGRPGRAFYGTVSVTF